MSEPYVTVRLPGPPRGKGRPRFRIVRPKDRRKPQFVTVYTDKETADYELRLRGAATTAMVGKRVLDEPVTVQIDALMPVPESWPRRAQAEALRGDLCHTAKPDMDNIVKLLDALNEIVWWDDSAVIQTVARKFYHAEPMLIISVWRWL